MKKIPWSIREKYVYAYLPETAPVGHGRMRFFPKQSEVLRTVDDDLQFLTIVGGIGAAKSYTSALYVLPEIVLSEMTRQLNGWRTVQESGGLATAEEINVWIVGPDHDKPRVEFQYIVDMLNGHPELLALAGGWAQPVSIPREGECLAKTGLGVTIKTKTWARVSGSDPLHAAPVHMLIVSEAGLLDDWTYENRIVPRIGRTNGMMVLGGTFEQSEQFLKRQYNRGTGKTAGRHRAYSIASWDNLFRYPGGRQDAAILMMEGEMSADTFLERCAGVPKKTANLVHSIFDYDVHVGDVACDAKGPVKIWVDPGPNGYGVLCAQLRGEGKARTAYIFEEYFEDNNGTSEKAIEWLLSRPYAARVVGGAIDARSMEARDIWAMGRIWQAKNRSYGLPLSARSVAVLAGVERVNSLLLSVLTANDPPELWAQKRTIGGNTGIPRIRIDRNCKRLIWEIEEGYKFEKSRDGTNKPKPKDENNHLTKALAYGLVDEFGFVEAVRARQQPSKHVPLSRLRREYQGVRNATH